MTEAARRWEVLLEQQPQKVLRKLPRNLRERIDRALRDLAGEPRPHGCKRLQSRYELYRVRVGEWRITYAVHDDKLIVVVIEIAPRSGADRNR